MLATMVDRHRVLCHAYCLMVNHYHLLVQTPDANLSRAMRHLNGVYTQRFNRRHERCGHVLQGRFGAKLIDGDAYLREVCRYIVLNPVRAGLVTHPRDWRWSSFCATAGEVAAPGFLTVDWVRGLGGARTPLDATRRFVSFVEAGIGAPESAEDQVRWRSVTTDTVVTGPLGDHRSEAARCIEFPRAQRFASRPSLARLFADVVSKADRNVRAAAAVRDHGYTMREVAEFLGLHYITVSRALAQADGLPSH